MPSRNEGLLNHVDAAETTAATVPRDLSPEVEPAGAGEHEVRRSDLLRIAFVAAAAAAVWFRIWEPRPSFSVIGVLATFIGGYPIFREALENFLERRMTMELSMTIALVAALLIREFFTALVITLFVLVAEVLEGMTVGRGRKAIRELLRFLPQTALLVRDGASREVPISALKRGDLVLVRPGSRIPVDGEVVSGSSFVDQSAITGEPMPVEKTRGSGVFAGTMNQSGAMEVQVGCVGRDTTFGRILEAVGKAEQSRAPIQKTADRLAGYLVYFALAAALLTFVLTRNVRSMISVVIVAGACGIAAGTPLAVLGGIGRAARAGCIIKGGLFLETLASVDTVCLDKTGTLTYGTPEVKGLRPAAGILPRELLLAAGVAERNSEHPIGKAIARRALSEFGTLPAPEVFQYQPGKGVLARVSGQMLLVGNATLLRENGVETATDRNDEGVPEVLVAREGWCLGSITIDDAVRPEAAAAIQSLREMGIGTILLTGDAAAAANRVARSLQVDQMYSELLPEQKLQRVQELVRHGKTVAMVGDGVNDAPALAEANVGVAMGSGTDVAQESADVVLIGNDLAKFVTTVRIARRCHAIIMQNFYGTLAVDSVGMGLAALGLLNPLLAALIHVSSELAFILNSARLLPSARVFPTNTLSR